LPITAALDFPSTFADNGRMTTARRISTALAATVASASLVACGSASYNATAVHAAVMKGCTGSRAPCACVANQAVSHHITMNQIRAAKADRGTPAWITSAAKACGL
jgi:hypothetical protein